MVLHHLLFFFSQERARVWSFNVRQACVQRLIFVVLNHYLLTSFKFDRQDYIGGATILIVVLVGSRRNSIIFLSQTTILGRDIW